MMTIEYEQALIEQATFLAARRDQRLEYELHQAIDPLYEISDEETRRRAFEPAFARFFAKLGLDRIVADLIAERPLVSQHVGRCVVREAPRAKVESAELFVRRAGAGSSASGRTLVIQVCPQSLVDSEPFALRMRRELLHVADMLDERFGYTPDTVAPGAPGARQSLLRDRYRVLWDIYVEGRLSRRGLSDKSMAAGVRRSLQHVFATYDPQAVDGVFDELFDTPTLTHDDLLARARSPELLFPACVDSEGSAGAAAHAQIGPGQPCPLCGFPTHDWFDFGADADGTVINAIRRNHAGWSPRDGACRQCAEMCAAAVSSVEL
jgi:hypothetical protein